MTELLEIVVVTYSSWHNAGSELRNMCALTGQFTDETHWTFVDNSPDDSDLIRLRALCAEPAHPTFLSLPNPGFAAACNMAVQASRAEWVLLLNPDVMMDASGLAQMLAYLREPTRNAESIAVSLTTGSRGHAGVYERNFHWFADRPLSASGDLLGPSGGAGLYRRDIFLSIGGFHEPLFAWGEDADLAYRLHSSGYSCEILDLRLPHRGGHSVASPDGARRKAWLLNRNRVVIAKRNLSPATYRAFVTYHAAILLILTPRNIRRGTVRSSWRGWRSGLRCSLAL